MPAFKILRTGMSPIQDVPQQLELDTLKEALESSKAKIINVQTLNRRSVKSNKIEYIPSRTVRIKFARQKSIYNRKKTLSNYRRL